MKYIDEIYRAWQGRRSLSPRALAELDKNIDELIERMKDTEVSKTPAYRILKNYVNEDKDCKANI